MLALPRLYAITDRGIAGCSHLDQVRLLVSAGVRLIQLREKNLSPRDFFAEACACVDFARSAGAQIVINDRIDIALVADADGVHLGQEDTSPELARELIGSNKLIGFSTHDLDQAREADALPVDYLAIGPVFPTDTKENLSPIVGLDNLREICAAVCKPVVAIGGIRLDNAAEVLRAGAQSVAVITDLVGVEDIASRTQEFLARLSIS